MTQLEYARTIRSLHRMLGWPFIASIIFSPLGIWIVRRGNRIYRSLTTPQSEHDAPDKETVLEANAVATSLIMSWDDVSNDADS